MMLLTADSSRMEKNVEELFKKYKNKASNNLKIWKRNDLFKFKKEEGLRI